MRRAFALASVTIDRWKPSAAVQVDWLEFHYHSRAIAFLERTANIVDSGQKCVPMMQRTGGVKTGAQVKPVLCFVVPALSD